MIPSARAARRPRTAGLLLILLAVLGGHGLQAQEVTSTPPGTRVRVTAPDLGLSNAVGVVRETPPSVLVVAMEGEANPMQIPFGTIRLLEVTAGKRRRVGRGGLIGVAVGGGAGILSGAAQGGGESYLWGGFLGGLMGGLAGLVAGAMIPTEEWVTVPLPTPPGARR